jgi:hypothetical protein
VLEGVGEAGEAPEGEVNRAERRATAAEMRKQSQAWPAHLEAIPREQWPPPREAWTEYPIAVYRSRHYLAQLFEAPPYNGVEVRRLSVNRVTIQANGHWEQDIPWEDLQRCKRETGHGDWYAVEIYPRDRDIHFIANMRHLWMLAEPLPIGWVGK